MIRGLFNLLLLLITIASAHAEETYRPGAMLAPKMMVPRSVSCNVVKLDTGWAVAAELNDNQPDEIDATMLFSNKAEKDFAIELCGKLKAAARDGRTVEITTQAWTQEDDGEVITGQYLRGVFFPDANGGAESYKKGIAYRNFDARYLALPKP